MIKDIINFIRNPIQFILTFGAVILVIFIIAKITIYKSNKRETIKYKKIYEIINNVFQYTRYSLEVNLEQNVTPRQKKLIRKKIVQALLFYLMLLSFPIGLSFVFFISELYLLGCLVIIIVEFLLIFFFRVYIIFPIFIKDLRNPDILFIEGQISFNEYNNKKIITRIYQDYIYENTDKIYTSMIFKFENLNFTFSLGMLNVTNYRLIKKIEKKKCFIVIPSSFYMLASINMGFVKPFGLIVGDKKNNKLDSFYPKYLTDNFLKKRNIKKYTIRRNKIAKKKTYQIEKELYKYKK